MDMNLADYLFDRSRHAATSWPRGFAEVLEMLCGALDDEGTDIVRAIEAWLQSDDYDRVRVALEFEDVFPFEHREEMEVVLAIVETRWPQLRTKCQALVDRRATQPARVKAAGVDERIDRLREKLRKMVD